MKIIYFPKLDAKTSLLDNTIDFYFSNNVFEHINIESISDILIEQKELQKIMGS